MQRLSDERGAVSVMVALLMIPLIAFAAIAVDVAAMHAERQQLQTGADAAAFAVAQDCGGGDCAVPADTAQQMVELNPADNPTATVTDPALSPVTGRVTVENRGVQEHWFARVLGYEESVVSARATAAWGAPATGTAVMPLIFSWCQFHEQVDSSGELTEAESTILLTKKNEGTECPGPGPMANYVPGGFGWIVPDDSTSCQASSTVTAKEWSDPGKSTPHGCGPEDFQEWVGQTVLLPLFDDYGGTGSNAWYSVHGYAAFELTGYFFGSGYSHNPPCDQPQHCIRGRFVEHVTLDESFTWVDGVAAPDLGATIVRLTD
ncbi:pilus assembly protein TadG-related protein [Georgenia wangjunii]|uniref:pilus assembly protein TadG-related protein n=1 Tax=Georgenia wangjunii TaxID=3117730 RepID=UPI002F26510A